MVREPIHIVLVCDDYYTILMGAFLKSIELNYHGEVPIETYIIDDNISAKNRRKISSTLTTGKLNLHWIKMTDAIPKDAELPFINNYYPLNILARLFIPHFIPSYIQRIIYFDVDMIMLDDITNLWHIDIGENIIGAISDTIGLDAKDKTLADGIANYAELGLNPALKYFNSGLLIIDVDKWKQHDITAKTLRVISENKTYAKLSDQYGLNVTLAGSWFEVDPKWSCFSVHEMPNPSLIHYFYRKPIYKSYTFKYRDEFYHYLEQTAWKGFKPIGDTSRYFKKVKNLLHKLLFKFR